MNTSMFIEELSKMVSSSRDHGTLSCGQVSILTLKSFSLFRPGHLAAMVAMWLADITDLIPNPRAQFSFVSIYMSVVVQCHLTIVMFL